MIDSLDPVVTEALRSWRVQLESGISSAQALELCSGMLRGRAAACFVQASNRTSQGEGITSVLESLAPVLTPGERAIIAAGWAAGRIEPTLDSLVAQRELWRNSRRRILSKAMMPVLTLLIASFVIPLPGLVAGSTSVEMYFVLVAIPLMLLIGFFAAGIYFLQARAHAKVFHADGTPMPANTLDRLMLDTPIVASVERQRSLAEFGDLLANLLSAGSPIVQALDLTARALRNGRYRMETVRLRDATARGFTLSTALDEEKTGLWPREFCVAVKVGEQSGTIDNSLARFAKDAREKYTRAIETFADWLPKIIYGCVALYMIYSILKMAAGYVDLLDKFSSPEN